MATRSVKRCSGVSRLTETLSHTGAVSTPPWFSGIGVCPGSPLLGQERHELKPSGLEKAAALNRGSRDASRALTDTAPLRTACVLTMRSTRLGASFCDRARPCVRGHTRLGTPVHYERERPAGRGSELGEPVQRNDRRPPGRDDRAPTASPQYDLDDDLRGTGHPAVTR
jgi:hypothetical protein